VPFDDFRADEQSETGAGNAGDGARSIAALEHQLLLCLRDADAAVADADAGFGAGDAHLDVDVAPIG